MKRFTKLLISGLCLLNSSLAFSYGGYYPFGDLHWKAPVATLGDLPASSNLVADARFVQNTLNLYVWNGSAWVLFNSSGATGATGSTGSTGATGTTGSTGSTGQTGLTGASGSSGSTGSTGATGATGTTGSITALAAFGSSPNANGATLSGTTLNLEPASASFPGGVTTGTQTFAGDKKLSSTLVVGDTSTIGTGGTIEAVNTAASSIVYSSGYASGSASGQFIGRGNGGTFASPSAMQSDQRIALFGARGYGATGFSTGSRASCQAFASENWSDTAQGAYMNFMTTPNLTASAVERMRINNDGKVFIGNLNNSTNNPGLAVGPVPTASPFSGYLPFSVTSTPDFAPTGTPSPAPSSTSVVGTSSSFTTQISIGDRISVAPTGTPTYVPVTAINSDTNLIVPTPIGTQAAGGGFLVKKAVDRWDAAGAGNGKATVGTVLLNDIGQLLIGYPSNQDINITSVPTNDLQIRSTSGNAALYRYTNATTGPTWAFRKSRSATVGTGTLVTTGDTLGTLSFESIGTDGAAYNQAATISVAAEGTIGSAIIPGNMTLRTANSSGTNSVGIKIDSAQGVFMPGLASSSAVTTGTVCWTTGTGLLNVDTTTTCLLSTRKIKDNIQPIDIGLETVMKLRPVSYDLKPEHNPAHLGPQVGLISEEVQAVDDRLVSKDSKGEPMGVRYQQLTAVLLKAVQEQQLEIKHLKKRLQRLEQK